MFRLIIQQIRALVDFRAVGVQAFDLSTPLPAIAAATRASRATFQHES
jgi:hypothetical protein